MDRSGSTTDSIDYVKAEIQRSISTLPKEAEFGIIFYSSGPPITMAGPGLVRPTEAGMKAASDFLDRIEAKGETDPTTALRQAFALAPDLIYLLTDGEFDPGVAALIKQLNGDGHVIVNTIAYLYPQSEKVLKQIAAQNGGKYAFISLANLVESGK